MNCYNFRQAILDSFESQVNTKHFEEEYCYSERKELGTKMGLLEESQRLLQDWFAENQSLARKEDLGEHFIPERNWGGMVLMHFMMLSSMWEVWFKDVDIVVVVHKTEISSLFGVHARLENKKFCFHSEQALFVLSWLILRDSLDKTAFIHYNGSSHFEPFVCNFKKQSYHTVTDSAWPKYEYKYGRQESKGAIDLTKPEQSEGVIDLTESINSNT